MYTRLRYAFGLSISLLSSLLIATVSSLPASAQQVNPQVRLDFLEDPLTSEERDPLLPELPVNRPYSPLEKQAIARSLDQLNQEAQQLFAAGQTDAAFALWRREIKLWRVIGPTQEFAAIRQVATIAWAEQRITDVQLLTLRTRELWDAMKTSLGVPAEEDTLGGPSPGVPEDSLITGAATADLATLDDLAQTLITLRDVDSTVEVYEQTIVIAAASDTAESDFNQTQRQIALAELHVEWFQFAEATNVYLTLLNKARSQGNTEQEIAYLEQLAYTYQQADALLNATRAQTDLVGLYQAQGENEKLPALLIAIAQNYRTLNLHTSAIDYYRAAYSRAQQEQQFSFSARVLQDLGSLYESLALTDDALGTYTLLVPVEEQAYNDYGIMNAHDKIGQLQRRQGNTLEALKAFQRALVIANRLGLPEDYFVEQIESVTQ